MAWSKSSRIAVMIVIDTVFLILELSIGYWKGSLALIADGFHMLNDIISLFVGLWAVQLARRESSDKYSYGWLRAEILGAFFNAVFLLALCVTIVLEAVQRFFDPPEITEPELIFIVGGVGLIFNIVGWFVLGGHGHSHGHGGDGHEHAAENGHSHDEHRAAEEGQSRTIVVEEDPSDETGRVADLLPEAAVARYQQAQNIEEQRHISFETSDNARDETRPETLDRSGSRVSTTSRGRERRRASSVRHTRLTSIDDMRIHPASFRQDLLDTISGSGTQGIDEEADSNSDSFGDTTDNDEAPRAETSPLLGAGNSSGGRDSSRADRGTYGTSRSRSRRNSTTHLSHHHNKPAKAGSGHGHSHGDSGMRAMILHVIGDMLGNIGVMVAALIIYFSTSKYRFYADPIVSLFITIIIMKTCVPLTKATSKILLQAVPDQIDLAEVRSDIEHLDGVLNCHHIHVWQLSDTKIVASMHIEVDFKILKADGKAYMKLQKAARKCLHAYGIHSATIQPEFAINTLKNIDGSQDGPMALDGARSPYPCTKSQGDMCMLECVDDCVGKGCCSTGSTTLSPPESVHSDHGHGDGHQH